MRRSRTIMLSVILLAAQACADHPDTTGPGARTPAAASLAAAKVKQQPIQMFDRCDALTFNTLGAGTCIRPERGVTLPDFIAEIQRTGAAQAWRFEPGEVTIPLGTTLLAVNRGGEVHTFTEVAHFGGGRLQLLNDLSGNPIPAPECLALPASADVRPGGSFPDTPDEVGTELYQCCIHPWMRTTVHIRPRS
ncbi:hypothetical protein J421_1803 [Gemmatirosa kalamazoonensis]|uniref:Uncharacterized protein n=1 Tax=Gemmatirosa kalamazoonensis TaxID=861299 RepID=W0RG85_9BACT|nr:hypothetical protein [Gemmatirosa kalamazoonensis]AHG89340.1 hypothetical protein J421_1803 [Gemmatirosa kalamazoonensis]